MGGVSLEGGLQSVCLRPPSGPLMAARCCSQKTRWHMQGRIDLDRALDFSGNLYTNGVTGCCIGCAAWQKWLNLGSRRVLM